MDNGPKNDVDEAIVESLLVGVVDTHVHSGPSTVPRAIDHIEMVEQASGVGYRAIVTKDHYYDGAPVAALVNAHFGQLGTTMISGVALNNAVGGLNPHAVEQSANLGGRIVWLPTFTARNHIAWQAAEAAYSHPGVSHGTLPVLPVDVLTAAGEVVDELKQVLDVVARTGQVLAGGHLHIDEIRVVFAEAIRRGVRRLLVLHPEEIVHATLADIAELASAGAYIEHSMNLFVDGSTFKAIDERELRPLIDAASVGRTILASDLGQLGNVLPIDGMRETIRICLRLGYAPGEIRQMISINGADLFGLDLD
ncbi:MAG TPA: DUF6282 family protein [Galbitalea sp.]|jgi:hypothetical protein